jgi:NADH-quinone oxidoreductase subunit C
MVGQDRMEAVKVRERFPNDLLKVKEFRGDTFLCIRRESLPDVIQFLKDDPDLQYDYFSECLGADYSTWEHDRDLPERFEVIYNLMSLKHSSRIFVKVGVDDGQKVPTIKHIFLGAEYPEREVADLFGVVFEGNEHQQRFLLPDDWIGFPLRKEYPLGGEDVVFDKGTQGPAVEDISMPHAGESFEGKTGSEDVSGR